ncbi:MAG: glycosyltransferase [Candidatus Pacebacteria bacterium]|nr:glycosyltransferase [Candidatus Paceibacterota bacterium]
MNNCNTPPLRILFVVSKFPILSEIFIFNQVKELVDAGCDVEILPLRGLHFSKDSYSQLEELNLFNRVIFPFDTKKNLIILFNHSFKNFFILLRMFKKINFYKLLSSSTNFFLFKNDKYDIIHCQFGHFSDEVINLREKGFVSGKIVVHFRGHDINSYVQKNGKDVYKKTFEKGDYFLANCDFFKEKAICLGCERSKISTFGTILDQDKFFYSKTVYPRDGKYKLITVGRLVEKKGVEYAIRAIKKIIKIYPNLEYTIVGDGELKKYLEDLTLDLGLGDVVKFVGWKSQTEVLYFLKKSHIFISPNKTASDGNMDAPTNTIKEAMSCGVFVISSNYPAIFELIKDNINGFLFNQNDLDDLVNKVLHVMNNFSTLDHVSKKAREDVVSKYDKNKLNNELISLYKNILKNS